MPILLILQNSLKQSFYILSLQISTKTNQEDRWTFNINQKCSYNIVTDDRVLSKF